MDEWLARFGGDLFVRLTNPLALPLLLAPALAAVCAARDGIKDARDGRPLFVWTLITIARLGGGRPGDGWLAVVRVVALGVITDLAYQFLVPQRFNPLELVFVLTLLALVPYLSLRGPFNRIGRRIYLAVPRKAHVGR